MADTGRDRPKLPGFRSLRIRILAAQDELSRGVELPEVHCDRVVLNNGDEQRDDRECRKHSEENDGGRTHEPRQTESARTALCQDSDVGHEVAGAAARPGTGRARRATSTMTTATAGMKVANPSA